MQPTHGVSFFIVGGSQGYRFNLNMSYEYVERSCMLDDKEIIAYSEAFIEVS